MKRSGCDGHTTSSACRPSSTTASGAATGTARTTARRVRGTRHGDRGARRGAGGDAVVDEDGGPARQRQPGTNGPVGARPLLHPSLLGGLGPLVRVLVDQLGPTHPLVDEADTTLGGRPHRQLAVTRYADLPHDHDVERCPQGDRHLGGDDDASTGQAEDDRRVEVVLAEHLAEPASGLQAIAIAHPHGRRSSLARTSRPGSHVDSTPARPRTPSVRGLVLPHLVDEVRRQDVVVVVRARVNRPRPPVSDRRSIGYRTSSDVGHRAR